MKRPGFLFWSTTTKTFKNRFGGWKTAQIFALFVWSTPSFLIERPPTSFVEPLKIRDTTRLLHWFSRNNQEKPETRRSCCNIPSCFSSLYIWNQGSIHRYLIYLACLGATGSKPYRELEKISKAFTFLVVKSSITMGQLGSRYTRVPRYPKTVRNKGSRWQKHQQWNQKHTKSTWGYIDLLRTDSYFMYTQHHSVWIRKQNVITVFICILYSHLMDTIYTILPV